MMRKFVKEHHLLDHRVDTIISVAEALINSRNGNMSPDAALRMIRMHHFLSEINLEAEYPYCVKNWMA